METHVDFSHLSTRLDPVPSLEMEGWMFEVWGQRRHTRRVVVLRWNAVVDEVEWRRVSSLMLLSPSEESQVRASS